MICDKAGPQAASWLLLNKKDEQPESCAIGLFRVSPLHAFFLDVSNYYVIFAITIRAVLTGVGAF